MSSALRALLLLPAAVLLASSWQDSQTQPPPPAMRITVTLVQVDAVVTDGSGRHIPDLRAEDFQILQDGQPQKIKFFSYVPEPPPPPKETPSPKAGKDNVPAPLGPPEPVSAGQVQRTVALVVDDMALSFEDMVRTRDSLRKYIQQEMQPGDLVAVVRTGGGVAILEQFTTDKRLLLEAVDLLKWKFYGRSGLGPIQPVGSGRDGGPQAAPEALDYGYALARLGALSTLEEVIQGMKRMPGRKSIVFLSDNLKIDPQIMDALDHITDLANRSAVSLYAVDPGGLRADSKFAAANAQVYVPDQTTRRFPGLGGGDPAETPDDEFGRQEGLGYLATRTGGIFYRNTNDIPGAIRKATDDQLGYYLLAYTPAEGTFDKNPRSAKFHKVTIKVTRPGLQVRWKSGFEGKPDGEEPIESLAPKTREQQLAEALASPFTATNLKVRLTSLFVDPKTTGPSVFSMLHFDASELTFIQEPDGAWNAAVDVITVAYRGFNQTMRQTQHVQPIHLSDAMHHRAMKEGFVLYVNTPVKIPGAFIIRAVVRDTTSQKIGSASQVIQVPDVRKGQLAVSGITIKLAPPEMMQKLEAAQQSTTNQQSTKKDGQVEEWTEGGPSLRRFRPGQAVFYGYVIHNPKLHGSPQQPSLTIQTRLYRDGRLVFTGAPSHQANSEQGDLTRFYAGGVLRLGSNLIPGEYILQATVTDDLAPKKKSRLSQWMDFEVVDAPSTTAARAAKAGAQDP